MSYIKEIFKRGSIGFLIGALLSYLSIIIITLQNETVTITSKPLLFQFGISTFLGFYLAASSVVYNVEHWSLLRQTITHFVLMIVYLPAAYIARWMPRNTFGIIIFVLVFLTFYMVQWIVFYTYWKKKAAELNKDIMSYKNVRESL